MTDFRTKFACMAEAMTYYSHRGFHETGRQGDDCAMTNDTTHVDVILSKVDFLTVEAHFPDTDLMGLHHGENV